MKGEEGDIVRHTRLNHTCSLYLNRVIPKSNKNTQRVESVLCAEKYMNEKDIRIGHRSSL